MIDFESYSFFIATALVLVVSPGPDTILVLSRTVASGTAAGLVTLLGTQTGNLIHAVLAGLGVSTLILFFPVAFEALKYLGAAYLLYLAWAAWRGADSMDLRADMTGQERPGRYFRQGLASNLANPKMIPFFIALFPQFIRPEHGPVGLQSLVFGLTLAGMALVWVGLLVIVAGKARNAIAGRRLFLRLANRLAAVTFAALACRLAMQRQP
jgi:threonine/homoserine/homoserine lactone efflux protein